MNPVIVRRHYETDRTGTRVISAGWCFDCPGCHDNHYLKTLTAVEASEWDLILVGDYGEEVSFRRKGKPDMAAQCIFYMMGSVLRFDARSTHHMRGKTIKYIVDR